MILTGDKLEMKFEGGGIDATYSPYKITIGERPINSAFESLDEHGILVQSTCAIKATPSEFGGMPESNGRVTAKFTDGILTIQGVSRGWKFEKDISILEYNGKSVQIKTNGDALRKITSS